MRSREIWTTEFQFPETKRDSPYPLEPPGSPETSPHGTPIVQSPEADDSPGSLEGACSIAESPPFEEGMNWRAMRSGLKREFRARSPSPTETNK